MDTILLCPNIPESTCSCPCTGAPPNRYQTVFELSFHRDFKNGRTIIPSPSLKCTDDVHIVSHHGVPWKRSRHDPITGCTTTVKGRYEAKTRVETARDKNPNFSDPLISSRNQASPPLLLATCCLSSFASCSGGFALPYACPTRYVLLVLATPPLGSLLVPGNLHALSPFPSISA